MHYLSHGCSKLDGDRTWHAVRFTEFSQTEATVLEDNYEPLPAREHGKEVYGLFECDLSDSSGRGVVTTPETIKTCLTDCLLS